MAQQLNADDAKDQGYLHHKPSSSIEPAKLNTESNHHITVINPKASEEILIRCAEYLAKKLSCRSGSHTLYGYGSQYGFKRDSNDEKGDTEDSEEEENRPGNCKTSGNQIFFDVEIGVSPPKSPTPPPRNEPEELPKSISPKHVDPGSDSKINGCFSWRKRKRLQSRVNRLK